MRTQSLMVLCVLALSIASAFGQSNYAAVSGTVRDAQSLPVAHARVEFKASTTGAVRSVTTNESGSFYAPALLPDDYQLTTTATGFAPVSQSLHLEVGQNASLDIALKIGAVQQGMEVSAPTETLRTSDATVGEVARSLYDDARKMLDRIIREKWFTAQATIGFWPANAKGDDILLYANEAREKPIATLHTLRQQLEKREGRFNSALSDFIAPRDSGVPDYIGAFVVTAGIGEDVVADRFKNANDDYSSILCKALADRLAEAFAERLHARVRREFWGYAPDENLSPDQLILEQYKGIRPAPGYPAQPDHTEKATLFTLLDAENTAGVKLTESYAMWPGSSVSGLYFSHAESFYFGVGKIERDQVEDYAARKGWSVAEAERWLAPVLNYIPAQDQSAQDRRVKEAMLAPASTVPANDVSSHPPGCNCAVHLAYRKKAARG